jgi:hypothetical protein
MYDSHELIMKINFKKYIDLIKINEAQMIFKYFQNKILHEFSEMVFFRLQMDIRVFGLKV